MIIPTEEVLEEAKKNMREAFRNIEFPLANDLIRSVTALVRIIEDEDELKVVICKNCGEKYAQEFDGQICPYCVDRREIDRLELENSELKQKLSVK